MNIRQFVLLVLAAVIVGSVIGVNTALADVAHCPAGESEKIEASADGELDDVVLPAGTQFCVKGGTGNSGIITSNGVTPIGAYLPPNDGGQPPNVSYYVIYPEPTATSEPTPTLTDEPPTPTSTDEVPEPTPTDTPDPEVSPTPTDVEPTETPTDPPAPTPTELPKTGAVLLPNDVSPMEWGPTYWQEDGLPANLLLTHQGTDSGLGAQVVMLQRGDGWSIGATDYEVIGTVRVEARDVWMLEFVAVHGDTVVMTCSGYNPVDGFWRYRVFVFLQEVK